MLIRDHSAHLCVVRITDQRVAVQVTFPLGGLRGKNVALVSLATLDLAGGSLLEPLGCAFVCFHFRHNFAADALHARLPILFYVPVVPVGVPPGAGAAACCCCRGCCGCGGCAGLSGFLPTGTCLGGARMACMVLPSMRGRNSTIPLSPTSLIRRSSTLRPRFWWAISRPRKRRLAFTLSPSDRKRSTWFRLVS